MALLPTLTDPDKLGLLIQCRMKMDKLNDNQLNNYANSTLQLLSMKQLKKLLFVGFNSIKNDIEYNQLFKMKTSINQIIENAKKAKNNKSKPKPKAIKEKKAIIPIVPKNASLTKTIPFDILSNNICTFLTMSSITELAKCDRKLAIICHTPTSIKNLMHRYDPYKYADLIVDLVIDGHYKNMHNWTVSNIHKLKNIEKLSINLSILEYSKTLKIFNVFQKVKHLSFYGEVEDDVFSLSNMKLMPLLKTIRFVNSSMSLPVLLEFLKKYKTNQIQSSVAAVRYYNKIIYQLTSIVFVDYGFEDLTEYERFVPEDDLEMYANYENILHFILQPQPNNLEILKFENSFFTETDDLKCNSANNEFVNIERIKLSLSNLKGFVYGQTSLNDNDQNLFLNLAKQILSNLILFNKLESLHTHSTNNGLISLYLNDNNRNALNRISELCISIPMQQNVTTSPLYSLHTLVPNLEKLCLVINISDNDKANVVNFETIIESILINMGKLKVFQIVAVIQEKTVAGSIDVSFCIKKIHILTEFTKILVNAFNWLRINNYPKQELLFKFHVKSVHLDLAAKCTTHSYNNASNSVKLRAFAERIQSMIMNYLLTYPLGKIQFKISWNTRQHIWIAEELKMFTKGFEGFFKCSVKEGGCLISEGQDYNYNDMDFKQYAVSVTKQNVDKTVDYERKWNVDCQYCCNTPWL